MKVMLIMAIIHIVTTWAGLALGAILNSITDKKFLVNAEDFWQLCLFTTCPVVNVFTCLAFVFFLIKEILDATSHS